MKDIIKRIQERTTLSTTLKVLNEMAFIDLLTELGYREDKMWTPDEDEKLSKLMKYAEKHTAHQMEEIKKHILKKIK